MDYIRIALGWLNEYAERAFSNAQQMEAQHEKHPDKESPHAQGLHAMAEAHKAAAQVYWDAADALQRQGRALRNEPIPTKLTTDAPTPSPAPEAGV